MAYRYKPGHPYKATMTHPEQKPADQPNAPAMPLVSINLNDVFVCAQGAKVFAPKPAEGNDVHRLDVTLMHTLDDGRTVWADGEGWRCGDRRHVRKAAPLTNLQAAVEVLS